MPTKKTDPQPQAKTKLVKVSAKEELDSQSHQKLLDYLNLEYTGAFHITFDILDQHKGMPAGTTRAYLKNLLQETGWEIEDETSDTIKLRRAPKRDK